LINGLLRALPLPPEERSELRHAANLGSVRGWVGHHEVVVDRDGTEGYAQ
jgi:hypothetical protein